jgi:hypothetical protein
MAPALASDAPDRAAGTRAPDQGRPGKAAATPRAPKRATRAASKGAPRKPSKPTK